MASPKPEETIIYMVYYRSPASEHLVNDYNYMLNYSVRGFQRHILTHTQGILRQLYHSFI